MLDDKWVGRRVSVRRALVGAPDARITFSDVVGDLIELTDQRAVIEAGGTRVTIPLDRVALARVAHPSTADVLALEAICERGWRAAESERVGGWLLRANQGFTGRANSALPLGRPESGLDATLAAARQWYAARGLPLRVQSPLPARSLLDAELGERGWPADEDVHVLAGRLDTLRAGPAAPVTQTQVDPVADEAWLAAYHYRGRALPELAPGLLARHPRAGFASVRAGDSVLAIARGVVDSGWLGVTAVEVDPAHRRQGLARTLMHALWRWAQDQHGAGRSYLQVEASNQPAISLYLRLGYWHHHDYRYRTEPG